MRLTKMILTIILLVITGLAYYLFRPLSNIPAPANFTCLKIEDGTFIARDSLPLPQNIYGMGLTYRKHLVETAAEFDPTALPPIFKKKLNSLTSHGEKVQLPTQEALIAAAGALEEDVAAKLSADFNKLSPMLDYEVELGFVLLDNITADDLEADDFIPKLGFFIANDLSARSIGLLGEGT